MTVEQWLGDNKLGIDIWYKKYQHNGETFDGWLDRISNGNNEVRQLILDKKFLFGGRILASRGVTDSKVTYSNCYVVTPPEDNIESIFDSMSKLARTFSYGGGCGIDIGKLRPKNAPVNNAAKRSSGSVSFMDLYSTTTSTISQQGRRGALMISIPVNHPDVEDFIGIKNDLNKVTSANISIRVDNKFMVAVLNDQDYLLHFKLEESGEEITKTVKAKELFHKLCENNWDYAEPGILFWDEISNHNLLARDKNFSYAGTNPCAEEPLPAGGSCLLGAVNLSSFVKNSFTNEAFFDAQGFQETVHVAVNALNDVLDEGLPLHPLKEQRESVANWRQIGLGIMGLADCLIRLGMVYGSDEANKFCDTIAHVMFASAVMESDARGEIYGAYPKFDKEAVNASPMLADAKLRVEHLNNSQLLTIAPTGSISSMLGVSGGIEPIFANSYTRKTESLHGQKEAVYYKVYTPIVKEYMEAHNISDEKDLPKQFVTSADIKPNKRIECQAAWQKWIDASISSTINLPNEATVEDVVDIYTYAWEKGLKGVTVYRAGCARGGVLVSDKEKKREETTQVPTESTEPTLKRGEVINCSDNLIGKKRKLISGCGSLHCQAWFDPETGALQEVYLAKGSTGGCVDADTEYFNGTEWKKISEYKADSDEKVLQYNEDGSANMVLPVNYIVNDNVESLKHFSNDYGLDMVLSKDHRMFLYKNYRKFDMGIRDKLTTEIVTVDEYLSREGSKERHVPTTFRFKGNGIKLSDDIIRLLVAIYADGTYDGHKIIVDLKREDKKTRFRKLLTNCDIGFCEKNIYNTDHTVFYLYPVPSIAEWFTDKQFTPKWFDCTDEQLKVVVDECVHWDGSVGEGNRLGSYYTSKKQEADFMQFALTRLGYRATIALNNSTTAKKDSYRIRWTEQNVHNLKFAKIEDYKTTDGRSYCFTVPSGLLVLRRNNQIFVTGNCNNFMIGLSRMISLACRAGVDIYTIKDQLDSTGACASYRARTVTKHDTSKGSCCPMAVGNALIEMWKEVQAELGNKVAAPKVVKKEKEKESVQPTQAIQPKKTVNKAVLCPECGEPLRFEGGCNSCPNCGYSKCN